MYRIFPFTILFAALFCTPWHALADSKPDLDPGKNISSEHNRLEEFFSHFDGYTRSDSHERPFPHISKYAFLEQGLSRCSTYSFKSRKPLGKSKTFLRFAFTVYEYEKPEAALRIFQSLFVSSDVDMGLTYAWDSVLRHDSRIYWLHAGCLFSKKSWSRIQMLLRQAVYGRNKTRNIHNTFECDCGLGCKKNVREENGNEVSEK